MNTPETMPDRAALPKNSSTAMGRNLIPMSMTSPSEVKNPYICRGKISIAADSTAATVTVTP